MIADMHLNEPHTGKGFANRRAIAIDRTAFSGFAVLAPSVLWLAERLDSHHITAHGARAATPPRLLPPVADTNDGFIDDGLLRHSIDCRACGAAESIKRLLRYHVFHLPLLTTTPGPATSTKWLLIRGLPVDQDELTPRAGPLSALASDVLHFSNACVCGL
jgi:hypothetical protein